MRASQTTEPKSMTALELVEAVAGLRPDADPQEQLRLALLAANQGCLKSPSADAVALENRLGEVEMHMQVAADQHAAMLDEIASLAAGEVCEFQPQNIWTLIRALRVQGQILDASTPELDVAIAHPLRDDGSIAPRHVQHVPTVREAWGVGARGSAAGRTCPSSSSTTTPGKRCGTTTDTRR